jgi:hypothetical protein
VPNFVSDRSIEAPEFWKEFRRASRSAQERIQEAMVQLADTGTCQVDEELGAEFRRILSTLPQLPAALVIEQPFLRHQFGR